MPDRAKLEALLERIGGEAFSEVLSMLQTKSESILSAYGEDKTVMADAKLADIARATADRIEDRLRATLAKGAAE